MQKTDTILWIIEDNNIFRNGIVEMLETRQNISCPHAFKDAESALRQLSVVDQKPDIILLDLGLPGMNGLTAIPKIKEIEPQIDIIVLTVFDDKPNIFKAISSGAFGYLLKSSSPDEIVQAIHAVKQGGAPLTPRIARHVLTAFASMQPKKSKSNLSPREKEILTLLSEGFMKKEIADKLNISFYTVDFHIRNIYKKLHVNNLTGAIGKAMKQGYI